MCLRVGFLIFFYFIIAKVVNNVYFRPTRKKGGSIFGGTIVNSFFRLEINLILKL